MGGGAASCKKNAYVQKLKAVRLVRLLLSSTSQMCRTLPPLISFVVFLNNKKRLGFYSFTTLKSKDACMLRAQGCSLLSDPKKTCGSSIGATTCLCATRRRHILLRLLLLLFLLPRKP